MDNAENIEYFKRYQPIGCRDENTAIKLRNHGIDAYFSGCLTLTIGDLFVSKSRSDKIYIVDPYFKGSMKPMDLMAAMLSYTVRPRVLFRLSKGLYHNHTIKSLLLTAQYYSIYRKLFSKEIIENAEYIQQQNHEIAALLSDEARFEYASELLHKYSEAALVITSRIHCALPSIGLGTRVIFTYRQTDNSQSLCRYDGLKDLFNVAYIKRGDSYVITEKGNRLNFVDNPSQIPVVVKYKKFKEQLIDRCRSFIKD